MQVSPSRFLTNSVDPVSLSSILNLSDDSQEEVDILTCDNNLDSAIIEKYSSSYFGKCYDVGNYFGLNGPLLNEKHDHDKDNDDDDELLEHEDDDDDQYCEFKSNNNDEEVNVVDLKETSNTNDHYHDAEKIDDHDEHVFNDNNNSNTIDKIRIIEEEEKLFESSSSLPTITYGKKRKKSLFIKVFSVGLLLLIISLPIIINTFLLFPSSALTSSSSSTTSKLPMIVEVFNQFPMGRSLLEKFWNLTIGDSLTFNNGTTLNTISEQFTHCRIFPIEGDKKGRAILQWKFISNQTFQNYYPLLNDTQRAKLQDSEVNPIVRMRMVIGEASLALGNWKIFGFSKSITSDAGFNTLSNNLQKSKPDKKGVQYRYFFDKNINDNRKIKILDFMNQPQATFHAVYLDGTPTFYVAYNNTSKPYLGKYIGTITTTKNYDHYPTCNDDLDMALSPVAYAERVNYTINEYQRFCVYQVQQVATYTGGTYIYFEKRLNSIVRPKNLPNTQSFSEDNLNATDHKYFVYFLPTSSNGYKNTTMQGQQDFLNTYMNKDSLQAYYLAHEVDFSVDYYDEDCDYYVQLYQTSVYQIYYYIRAVRHTIVGIFSLIVSGFIYIYRKKQPVKSRLQTAMISALISVIFNILGVISDIYTVFNYDAIEYAYYLTLAMLYLVSLVRYTFVRNLYRIIRIVDKMEDTVISVGEFNDEGIVLNYKRKTMQMKFLSKLASKRIYLSAIISLIIIVNIPTPFFLWLLHNGSADTFAIVNSIIVYVKLVALIVGFVLPGFVALSFDMFVNRKWLFYDFFNRICNCGNGNISTYMKKVLSKTKKMEEFTCGFQKYFSDYDDPLCYRIEFLLVTSLSLIIGVSTFVVGTIDIPNWRTSLKLTILCVHGVLYFLFDYCYVLLTSGFVVFMQLIVERRKWKTKAAVQEKKATLTGKNPITLLLIKTIGDRTGEGRELIYKFCCKEFSLELLILFERCCKVLELLKDKKYMTDPQIMNKKVCDIYNSFVKTSASLEVAIPYELKIKISAFVESSIGDEQSVSTDSTYDKKIYSIFKTEQQLQPPPVAVGPNVSGADNRSIEEVNEQTAVLLSDLIDQLKESTLSSLQDTFSRLMATKAYMAYFKKKEMEAQTMKEVGFNREDTIELDVNALSFLDMQQQHQQPNQFTTIDMGGTQIVASINTNQQEQVSKNYLQAYDNGDEIAITEDSTETEEEIIEEVDTRHSLDKIDD